MQKISISVKGSLYKRWVLKIPFWPINLLWKVLSQEKDVYPHWVKSQLPVTIQLITLNRGEKITENLSFLSKKCVATWQNQKSDCAPREDSDKPGHPPSLIRVFAVRMKKAWVLSYPLSAQWRLLIRLRGCSGRSESSLGTQSLCWFCHEAAQIS